MRRTELRPPPAVTVEVGELPEATARYARDKILKAVQRAGEPVLAIRVRITVHPDPAVERPVVAQANVDLGGRPVRAEVTAPTPREAVDLLEARLRHRLDRFARDWEARRGRQPVDRPHEWRRGSAAPRRPLWFPRDPAERLVIERESFSPAPATLEEAAFELDVMDHAFHLFTELESGQDSVLYRAGPTGLRLAQVNPAPGDPPGISGGRLTVSPLPAPLLTVTEATDRLEISGLPFLFYLDGDRARGCVLYHRYDGHYGLIVPPTHGTEPGPHPRKAAQQ